MHSVHDAYELIIAAVSRRAHTTAAVDRRAQTTAAVGRRALTTAVSLESTPLAPVLSAVRADTPLPPYDRVAMDGIAICLDAVGHSMPGIDGIRHFRREGLQPAGAAPLTLQDAVGGCIEVMTGAMLPHGCDTVINYERLEATADGFRYQQGDQLDEFKVGDNVHHRGSDYPEGHALIPSAALATGPVAGLLASVGMAHYEGPYQPEVAIVATGDELVPITATPEPHQIRRSNGYALRQLLADYGFTKVSQHHLPDQPAALSEFIASSSADVIVFSGGVSKGRKDYIPEVIRGCGGDILVHGVSQRPGKPLLFAQLPRSHSAGQPDPGPRAIFGLPGNPVSTLVCGLRYLVPALRTIAGTSQWPGLWAAPVRLAAPFRFKKPLTRFVPVTLAVSAEARLEGTPIAIGGSGDFASLVHSDGVLELPLEGEDYAAGEVYPYYGWQPLALGRSAGGES